MANYESVDQYISSFDAAAQTTMHGLRKLILETVPGVEERISYNVPFYKYYGEFVGFAAYKQHISFGFGSDGLEPKLREELTTAGYKLGKGTLQIKFDQEVPTAAIKQILTAKAVINEANN